MKKIGTLVFFMLMGFGLKSEACIGLSMYLSQPSYYSQTGAAMTDTLSVVVSGNTLLGACNYFVTFDYGSGSSFSTRAMLSGSKQWPYQIYKDSGATQILKRLPDATSCSDVICDTLPGFSFYTTKTNPYTMVIDRSNPWRAAGRYSDSVTVRLYQGTILGYVQVDSKTMNMTFDAHKRVDISVVPTGGSFDLNRTTHLLKFPSMETGMQKTADIIMKYNAGCNLFAWSANGGVLKHSTQNDTIAYTFNINGSNIPIPWWTQVASRAGASPASGSVNPVVITIGSTSGKPQGTYTDTINLVVQSNE